MNMAVTIILYYIIIIGEVKADDTLYLPIRQLTLYRNLPLRCIRWCVQDGNSGGGGPAAANFGARLAGWVKLKSSPTTSTDVWVLSSAFLWLSCLGRCGLLGALEWGPPYGRTGEIATSCRNSLVQTLWLPLKQRPGCRNTFSYFWDCKLSTENDRSADDKFVCLGFFLSFGISQ